MSAVISSVGRILFKLKKQPLQTVFSQEQSSSVADAVSSYKVGIINFSECVLGSYQYSFNSEKLRHSKYGTPDTLDHITKRFDETTKRLFRDKHDAQYIPFGSPLDKDLKAGIRGGQLKLTGYVLLSSAYPSIPSPIFPSSLYTMSIEYQYFRSKNFLLFNLDTGQSSFVHV